MKLYYLTRWQYFKIKLNNRFGPRINRMKIKRLEKKLPKLNRKVDELSNKSRRYQKELQSLYLRDSVTKMREDGWL